MPLPRYYFRPVSSTGGLSFVEARVQTAALVAAVSGKSNSGVDR